MQPGDANWLHIASGARSGYYKSDHTIGKSRFKESLEIVPVSRYLSDQYSIFDRFTDESDIGNSAINKL
jgi:hypothetical protein